MSREKKDAKILNVKLASPVNDKLEQFCDKSRVSKTIAIEKILT